MIIITAALPYGNNSIHLGHIFSTFLPADICARAYRYRKHSVQFISGMDAYGTPILITAYRENTSPQTIHDKYLKINREILDRFHISLNIFDSTTNQKHHKNVQTILASLSKNTFEKEIDIFFCSKHQIYLTERLLTKRCLTCKKEYYDQEECEHDEKNKEILCSFCSEKPQLSVAKHIFLNMSEDRYGELLKKTQLNKVSWQQVDNINLNLISPHKAITRDNSWGVPLSEERTQSVYVWIEALMFYSTFSNWNDPKEYKIQFMGKDNVFFHTYIQSNLMDVLPDKIISSHFLQWKGEKLSKSKQNTFDLIDLSLDNCDFLRLYLASISNLKQDANFNFNYFLSYKNNVIIKKIFNVFQRIISLFSMNNIFEADIQYDENSSTKTFFEHCMMGEINLSAESIVFQANDMHKQFDEQQLWKYDSLHVAEFASSWFNKLLQYKNCLQIFLPYTVEKYLDSWLYTKNDKIFIFHRSETVVIVREEELNE